MSQSLFKVTCLQCRTVFSTPFPQDTAVLRCPGCEREASGRQFQYAGPRPPMVVEDRNAPSEARRGEGFEIKDHWILFKCPHCQWAMRIREELSATSIVDCGRCGLEILPPDPEAGTPATLTRAGADQLSRLMSDEARNARGNAADATSPFEVAEAAEVPQVQLPARTGRAAPGDEPLWKGSVKPLRDEQLGRAFREREAGMGATELPWDEIPSEAKESEVPVIDQMLRYARAFRMVMICGIVVLAVLGLLVRFGAPEKSGVEGAARAAAATGQTEAPRRPVQNGIDQTEVDAVRELGRRMVGQADWERMLPRVRHRERVEPIMRDFYARNPFVPQTVESFDPPVAVEIEGKRYLQLGAVVEGGERRVFGFEETDQGWMFDWEVYEDVAADQWSAFLAERPSLSRALRFAFIRASVSDRYYEEAGIPVESGLAVRIWLRNRGDSLVAVFPRDSLAGAMIERLGSWDVGKLVIGELAFPAGGTLRDRVAFEHLLQERWLVTGSKERPVF